MQPHWILDALADLKRYAADHDMDELARHLEDASNCVATASPVSEQDKFSRLSRDLGAPRRLH